MKINKLFKEVLYRIDDQEILDACSKLLTRKESPLSVILLPSGEFMSRQNLLEGKIYRRIKDVE